MKSVPDALKITLQLRAYEHSLSVRAMAPGGEARAETDGPSHAWPDHLAGRDPTDISLSDFGSIGKILWQCLMPGDVHKLIFEVLQEGRRSRSPVHLELRFDHDQVSLAQYPWELIMDDMDRFLVRDGLVDVTRYIAYPQPPPVLGEMIRDLSLLRVVSQPITLAPITVTDLKIARIETLLHATFEQFQHKLLIERPTLWGLHFDGHGSLARQCCKCGRLCTAGAEICACGNSLADAKQIGLLAFERNGDEDWISAQDFGAVLYNARVQVALLLACETARIGNRSIFSALASGLVLAGVPAVIGMQHPVTDRFACAFSNNFYSALFQSNDLLDAVRTARRMSIREEWYSPALYLRHRKAADEDEAQRSAYHTRSIDTAVPGQVRVGAPFLVKLWIRRPDTKSLAEEQLREELDVPLSVPIHTKETRANIEFEPIKGTRMRRGAVEVRLGSPHCEVEPSAVELFVDEDLDAPPAIFAVWARTMGHVSLIFSVWQEEKQLALVTHHIQAKSDIEQPQVMIGTRTGLDTDQALAYRKEVMTDIANLLARAEQAMQDNDWDRVLDLAGEVLGLHDHPLAARLRREATDKKARYAEICELITQADELGQQGKYQEAIYSYDRAQDIGTQANILGCHAQIEYKRTTARERLAWRSRVDDALRQVAKHTGNQERQLALEILDPLLTELKATAYDDLTKEVQQAHQQVIDGLDAQAVLEQAQEAFRNEDFERAIELVERSIAGEVSDSVRKSAAQLIAEAHKIFDKTICPTIESAEAAYDNGRLDDAAALLYNLRSQYPKNPTWKRMWLTVYMDHGLQQLDIGRQVSVQHCFEEAVRAFTEAREAFAEVLEVYPKHTGAVELSIQADELRQIAVWGDRAQADWEVGRRPEARGALKKARDLLDGAAQGGQDYSTVSATVDAMLAALDEEIERAREEERLILRAQQLLGEGRLQDAKERFEKALDALEPETAKEAQEGLRRVDEEQQAFQKEIERAQTAADPMGRVEFYQAAYDRWPTGPDMPNVLVEALVRAAQTALHGGFDEGAAALANRALALDGDHTQAKDVLNRVEKGPAVRAILEEVNRRLIEVEREAEPAPEQYEAVLLQLQNAQGLAEAMPDLSRSVEDALRDARRRRQRLQEYKSPAAQAETQRRAGDWEGAVAALEQAVDALGDLALTAPRERLTAWRRVMARLAESKKTAQEAFAQAQMAYEDTLEAEGEGRYDFARALTHLGQARAALNAARKVTDGFLPPDFVALEHQVEDLHGRADVAQETWELSNDNLLEAVRRLRTATQMRQGDPVLEALRQQLETQLEEQSEIAAAEYQKQAKTALDQGDITEAVDLLRQAMELRDTSEIQAEFTRVRRMADREAQIRDLELDYLTKLESDSKPDALGSLADIVRLLISPETDLPQEVRRAANDLLQLGKRLDQPDVWDQAQELLKQLGDLGLEDPSAARLYRYANQWLELARSVVLDGIIASSALLGQLETAYRAAQQALRDRPREEALIRQLVELRHQLVNSLDQSARKRLSRAQELVAQGSYAIALENLEEIEEKYSEAEHEFEGLLRDHDEAAKIREQARDLHEQATHLRALAERVSPLVVNAREAYGQGQIEQAEEILHRIELQDPHGEALALKKEAEDLRQRVQALKAERASKDLENVLTTAEMQLGLAQREDDFQEVIDLLTNVSIRGLSEAQRARHRSSLREADHALRAFREGRKWRAEGEQALARGDYAAAVRALERALQVTREDRVAIQTMLEEATEKRDEQQKQDELLEAGKKLLAAGEYLKAQHELSAAHAVGADVSAYLPAARAGVLLDHGWSGLQEGNYSTAERDLGEAISLGEDNEWATEIVSEARRLLERLEGERGRQAGLQAKLSEARLFLRKGQFEEAESKAHDVLAQDSTHREAYNLLAEIEDRRRAQMERMEEEAEAERLYAQAMEAFKAERYNEADALVSTIRKVLADYTPAIALAERITTEREAREALARAEGFAHIDDFKNAEASLEEAFRINPGHPRLGEVQQLIRRLHQEWEREALQPIRSAYREGKYHEALAACRQALERGATPEFQSQVEGLQQDIVNRWTEARLNESRDLLEKADTVESFAAVANKVRQTQEISPQPSESLVAEAERLWRKATEARLRKHLEEALERSATGDHQRASVIYSEVEQEASEYGFKSLKDEATTQWIESRLREARHAIQSDDYERAEALIAMVSALAPKHPTVASLRSRLTIQQKTSQALAQARALADRDDFTGADKAIQDAIQLDPLHPQLEVVQAFVRKKRSTWQEKAIAKVKDSIEEAQQAAIQLFLRRAERLLQQAQKTISSLQDDNCLPSSNYEIPLLLGQIEDLKQTIDTARELWRSVAEAQSYLARDIKHEEAVALLNDVLTETTGDESDIIKEIKTRTQWLLVGKNLLEGEYDAAEQQLLQRFVYDEEVDRNVQARLQWIKAQKKFDQEWQDRRTTSQAALAQITTQLQTHREEAAKDARIWKWVSVLAAVTAFSLLVFAVVFLIQSREPLTYLSTLPGLLTGISIPFIHKFYIRALDQVNNHGAQVLEQWKNYEEEENQRKKAMFDTILGDIRESHLSRRGPNTPDQPADQMADDLET